MRLSETSKARVLAQAKTWVEKPMLVRVGEDWAVLGRDRDQPKTWTAMLVREVRVDGPEYHVWWSHMVAQRRTRGEALGIIKNTLASLGKYSEG